MDPDPYRDTRKTCLGGGVHCPRASSYGWFPCEPGLASPSQVYSCA